MKRALFRLIAVVQLTLLSSLPAHAGTIQLPQTGQTTCWGSTGAVLSCTGTGQDGDRRIGAALPTPRFVDNGNGTVTDRLNGLVWLKNGNCTETVGGIAKSGGTLAWQNALTWSNSLASGSCGLTDGSTAGQWRLPNVNELASIVNRQHAASDTWLNAQGFTNVQGNDYWSASTYAYYPLFAWVVDMNGSVGFYDKAVRLYVWPVRSGQ